MQTDELERQLRDALRQTLDHELGPDPSWAESPAAQRAAGTRPPPPPMAPPGPGGCRADRRRRGSGPPGRSAGQLTVPASLRTRRARLPRRRGRPEPGPDRRRRGRRVLRLRRRRTDVVTRRSVPCLSIRRRRVHKRRGRPPGRVIPGRWLVRLVVARLHPGGHLDRAVRDGWDLRDRRRPPGSALSAGWLRGVWRSRPDLVARWAVRRGRRWLPDADRRSTTTASRDGRPPILAFPIPTSPSRVFARRNACRLHHRFRILRALCADHLPCDRRRRWHGASGPD